MRKLNFWTIDKKKSQNLISALVIYLFIYLRKVATGNETLYSNFKDFNSFSIGVR